MILMPPMCGIFFFREVMELAATRLIAMRKNKGKSIAACLNNHTSYIKTQTKPSRVNLSAAISAVP